MTDFLTLLDEVELIQGGANGPTIKLRAALAGKAAPRLTDAEVIALPGSWALNPWVWVVSFKVVKP